MSEKRPTYKVNTADKKNRTPQWKLHHSDGDKFLTITDIDGKHIAEIPLHDGKLPAIINGYMMSASPQLLAVCKEVYKILLANTEFSGDLFKDELEIVTKLLEAIHAAEPDWTPE